MKVCIDAGHSPLTAGKRSFDGTFLEYHFNWTVAQFLANNLRLAGIKVCQSRNDIHLDISPKARALKANEMGADILVSLHANAYGESFNDVSGWEIYINKLGGESEKLARCIMDSSIPFLGLKNRGIKCADFTILQQATMPAVLIEQGFYSNLEELQLLKTLSFQQKCAKAAAMGILAYKDL